MIITIYADSTEIFTEEFCNKNNLINVEIETYYVKQFFKDEILESFQSDDKDISEDELFEKWFNEYTADDTTELWEWCNRYGIDCRIDRIL